MYEIIPYLNTHERYKFNPKDTQYDEGFKNLCTAIKSQRILLTYHLDNILDQICVNITGTRETIREFGKIKHPIKYVKEFYETIPNEEKYNSLGELGFVIRGFGKHFDLYKNMKNHWNIKRTFRDSVGTPIHEDVPLFNFYTHCTMNGLAPLRKFVKNISPNSFEQPDAILNHTKYLAAHHQNPFMDIGFKHVRMWRNDAKKYLTFFSTLAKNMNAPQITKEKLAQEMFNERDYKLYENSKIYQKIFFDLPSAQVGIYQIVAKQLYQYGSPKKQDPLFTYLTAPQKTIQVINGAYEIMEKMRKEEYNPNSKKAKNIRKTFFNNLQITLKQNTAHQWAEHIATQYTNGIGGQNFRFTAT